MTVKMAEKNKKTDGIRIQLKGLRSMQELRAMLNEAVDKLEALPITHARAINLYVTPADKNASPVYPRGEDGRKITTITLEQPYRSVAEENGL